MKSIALVRNRLDILGRIWYCQFIIKQRKRIDKEEYAPLQSAERRRLGVSLRAGSVEVAFERWAGRVASLGFNGIPPLLGSGMVKTVLAKSGFFPNSGGTADAISALSSLFCLGRFFIGIL